MTLHPGSARRTRSARSLEILPDANLALVSIPGEYVADEVTSLLERDLNVMIFSDNVSVDDELRLKQTAYDRGLLLMGPDCGTAAIKGVPLAFANVVTDGNIGIVGASGTGTQEVMSQIDQLGGGISNVIGLGGRDLGAEIGGIMCLQALATLENDPATSTIVIVSKPPAPAVRERIEHYAQQLTKRVVAASSARSPPSSSGETSPSRTHSRKLLPERSNSRVGARRRSAPPSGGSRACTPGGRWRTKRRCSSVTRSIWMTTIRLIPGATSCARTGTRSSTLATTPTHAVDHIR